MNKMKAIRIAAIFLTLVLTLVAVTAIALPVQAKTTYTSKVKGIEVFPGYISGGERYGATFVGQATGDLQGTFSGFINYTPDSPKPNGTNTIQSGYWSIAVQQSGKIVGVIAGKVILPSSASWTGPIIGIETGTVSLTLTVTFGTGVYKGISGSGSFTGQLSHLTMPPTFSGTLQLSY